MFATSRYYCSVAQLYPTLCDPVDCSPPGSSVHRILQARILEWVAKFSSRGSFQPQGLNPSLSYLLHWQAGSLQLAPSGRPIYLYLHFFLLCSKWGCRAGLIKTLIPISRHRFYSAKNKYIVSFFGKT